MLENNVRSIYVASATDDEKTFKKGHFGDASFYQIFKINPHSIQLIKTISNTEIDSDQEGHKHKAKQILSLLKRHAVDVLINQAFGQNIVLINQVVLPVVVRNQSIDQANLYIQSHFKEFSDMVKSSHIYVVIEDEEYKIVSTKKEDK